MDLNPLDWAKSGYQQARDGLGWVASPRDPIYRGGIDAVHLSEQVDQARDDSSTFGEMAFRVKEILSGGVPPVYHGGPLMDCPPGEPLNPAPVPVQAGAPAELLPQDGGVPRSLSLTEQAPGATVAIDVPPGRRQGLLTVNASGPGTNWGVKGRESAVMTVFVDGKYNQDVVLYRGATAADYPLNLGDLPPGHHTVTLAYDRKASTPGASGVEVNSVRGALSTDDTQGLVERYQPFFYGRGKGVENNHTDTPLKMWCEVEHRGENTVLHYSVVHSNEDGGTAKDPAQEMAVWGRITDPDPICDVTVGPDGQVKGIHYVAVDDQAYTFHGHFEGQHPILRVDTANNNYDDQGTSHLLFKPRVEFQQFDGARTREDLMNENPWMYRVSNQEVTREGKVMSDAQANAMLAAEQHPGFKRPTGIEDARDYLYVDFGLRKDDSPIHVEVQLKGSNAWYSSNLGDQKDDIGGSALPTVFPEFVRKQHYLNQELQKAFDAMGIASDHRQGFNRTTVPLPPGTKPEDVAAIRVVDDGTKSVDWEGISKVFMLGQGYQPVPLDVQRVGGIIPGGDWWQGNVRPFLPNVPVPGFPEWAGGPPPDTAPDAMVAPDSTAGAHPFQTP